MKLTSKFLAIVLAAGIMSACTSRNESTSEGREDSQADSVELVAPSSADGTPTGGSSPSNPGSPADSAAQAVEADSIR